MGNLFAEYKKKIKIDFLSFFMYNINRKESEKMTREEFKSLVDTIKEKLDETTGALLAEDLIAILSAYNGKMEEIDKLSEENIKLKKDNEEILKVNGQLFQKVGSIPSEKNTEEKIINDDKEEVKEEEKITIDDVIDEKGDLI